MKPTKFDLMRANRARWDVPAFRREWRELMESPPAQDLTPIPYMEIDGVRYMEAPERKRGSCEGCEFWTLANCLPIVDASVSAFGRSCMADGRTIYIKAA